MFHMPQAFGTLDTVATFSRIENVYWAMKETVEENFPEATFIGHFSHWYDWGCMLYARFIFEQAPEDPAEAAALYNRVWDLAIRAAIPPRTPRKPSACTIRSGTAASVRRWPTAAC